MFAREKWTLMVCFCALNLVLGKAYGSEDTNAPQVAPEGSAKDGPPSIEALSAACLSAKTAFSPRTEAHLAEAKTELAEAVARLDGMLRTRPGGDDWREFLDWKDLEEQLALDDGPDLRTLDALYAKYAGGHEGLELAEFVEVREALRGYLTTARAIGNPKLQKQYEAVLDALPKLLEEYHAHPEAEGAMKIGEVVLWLEQAGQAADPIRSIREYFSQPNLFLQVSADLIDAGIGGPVDETGPVTDVILGARVSGTEHTTGRLYVELLPNDNYAEITTVFQGKVESQTVSSKGPARVSAGGDTRVASRKTLRINADRIWTLPTQSRAITHSNIQRVRTVRGGPIIKKAARHQASSQKGQTERIAARHAKQRSTRRIDEQANPQVAELAKSYKDKFRRPLLDRNLFPQLLRFRTTEKAVHTTALHGGLSGLGASGPPPALDGDHDLAVRVHESLVNNFMAQALGGAIVKEEVVRARLTEMLGSTPTWLEPDEETEPWTIAFARSRPVTVAFAEGRFTVTLRGRRYHRGESAYPGMNVTAAYKIEKSDAGFKAVRQGDLAIFPPGFVPGRGRQLSTRQQVLRSLLEKTFDNVFQEEIVPEPLVLSGEWEKAGKLVPVTWQAAGGWLVLAWKRVARADDTAPATETARAVD